MLLLIYIKNKVLFSLIFSMLLYYLKRIRVLRIAGGWLALNIYIYI